MAAPPPPHSVVLIDDLIEEFLIRLPLEDPAVLGHTALVSKQWYRLITGPIFRRRFREFHHRFPPLLGYILNLHNSIRFVSLSSFCPRYAELRDVRAIHSSHGRVLLQRYAMNFLDFLLSVWDPITDEQRDLPMVPCPVTTFFWDAAMVCAVGDGCNHLHCGFKVVFVGIYQRRNFSCFYSSEAHSWSDPIFASGEGYHCFMPGNCVLVESALYFRCAESHKYVKYELLTHQMCAIGIKSGGKLIATEDGRIGVAKTWNSKLRLWLRDNGGWKESRAIELHTLRPDDALCENEAYGNRPFVAGFAEVGAGVIFLRTSVGYFTIDLNSGRSKKVGGSLGPGGGIVPYVSFCTPAPGAVSTSEGLVEVCTDEVPGAGVAVSTDEGPGAGVVVSTDEGPAAGMCQVHKKQKLQVQSLLNQEGNY